LPNLTAILNLSCHQDGVKLRRKRLERSGFGLGLDMEPREVRDKVRWLASATVKVTKAEEVMLFLILLFYAEVD
jgi:hypothetical protein